MTKKRRYELRFSSAVLAQRIPGLGRRVLLREHPTNFEMVYAYLIWDRLTGKVLKDRRCRRKPKFGKTATCG